MPPLAMSDCQCHGDMPTDIFGTFKFPHGNAVTSEPVVSIQIMV